MTRDHKAAGELELGDVIVVSTRRSRVNEEMTVLSATEFELNIKRKVRLVTLRAKDGTQFHRSYGYFTTIRVVKEA